MRSAIKKSKKRCWLELCADVERDPWGLPYRIVSKRFARGGLSERSPAQMEALIGELFPDGAACDALPPMDEEENITPFTREELNAAAKRLTGDKAPGPDGIPNEVLRIAVEACPEALLGLYNGCLSEGVFCKAWKRQKLVLLPKKGKPLDAPSAYRPLCMLDVVGKLLETLIMSRLRKVFEGDSPLSNSQYGFRPGRSTVDAVDRVIEIAKKAVRMDLHQKSVWRYGGFCALITVDVRNAFNSATWKDISRALRDNPGVPRYLTRLVHDYLHSRTLLYGTTDGQAARSVTAGVPQGSVLGPLLWNIMYDDVLRLDLPEDSEIVGFADDIAVVVPAKTTETLGANVDICLERVSAWLAGKCLSIAEDKCEAVLFTRRRTHVAPIIHINRKTIVWRKAIKYLGVWLDGRFRFDEHVARTTDRAKMTALALARIMPNVEGAGQWKRQLYSGVVHSILLYGAPIWESAVDVASYRRKLEAAQRICCLRITCAYRTISGPALQVLAGVVPIDLQVRERAGVYREAQRARRTGGGPLTDTQMNTIKTQAREDALARWQERWAADDDRGRWTRKLIPNVIQWYKRKHGQVTYHLTQALSGHGCFQAYLNRIGRAESPVCIYCPEIDGAEHTLYRCPEWSEERRVFMACVGATTNIADTTADNMLEIMLCNPEKWDLTVGFITKIIKLKEERERSRKRSRGRQAEETAADEGEEDDGG